LWLVDLAVVVVSVVVVVVLAVVVVVVLAVVVVLVVVVPVVVMQGAGVSQTPSLERKHNGDFTVVLQRFKISVTASGRDDDKDSEIIGANRSIVRLRKTTA
jgi:hypothetical protein